MKSVCPFVTGPHAAQISFLQHCHAVKGDLELLLLLLPFLSARIRHVSPGQAYTMLFILFHVDEYLPACLSVDDLCACIHGGQNTASNPLELEF